MIRRSPEWAHSPPREEGWLRHQEIFGEAHLRAADGVVAYKSLFGVSDHPGRSASTPPHEEGTVRTPSLPLVLIAKPLEFLAAKTKINIGRIWRRTASAFSKFLNLVALPPPTNFIHSQHIVIKRPSVGRVFGILRAGSKPLSKVWRND